MPVRKIPKNHIHVTGGFSSRKSTRLTGYESPLEREYMLLLEFDPDVERFEEQPVRIWFRNAKNRRIPYVPDILIHYYDKRPAKLVEVKATSDLERNADRYALKFDAAKEYAAERGWVFQIVMDTEIRGPYLENLKFLREYREVVPDPELLLRATAEVAKTSRGMSIDALLDCLAPTESQKLLVLPAIFHLVVLGRLKVDLSVKLTYQSRLTLPGG